MKFFAKFLPKSLATRLISSFLLMSLLIVSMMVYTSLIRARDALKQSAFDRLEAIAALKENELNRWVEQQIQNVLLLVEIPAIKARTHELLSYSPAQASYQTAYQELSRTLDAIRFNLYDFDEIFIISLTGGKIMLSTDKLQEGEYKVKETYYSQALRDTYVQKVYPSPTTFKPTMTIATPLYNMDNEKIGVLAAHINLDKFDKIVQENTGLGQTGETYLIDKLKVFISAQRFGREAFPDSVQTTGIDRALQGQEGVDLYLNYAGVAVIGAYRWVETQDLALLVEVGQAEAFAPAQELATIILIISIIASMLLVTGVSIVAYQITRPIKNLVTIAQAIEAGDLSRQASPIGMIEFDNLAKTFNSMTTQLSQTLADLERKVDEFTELNQAYERFVPREFISLLDKQAITEVQLGNQVEKEMTVLFSDIRGFTSLSESMTPQENFDFINSYLSRMEPIIGKHNGFIDKYIGDAIMALFPNADDAVQGAIEMLLTLRQFNQEREAKGGIPVQIGIGLNTGVLMLGTVGGQNRMDGTVIADAVNLASRVEGLTKLYGTSLLITQQTYVKLSDPLHYHVRVIDNVQVKGKSEVVTVYEIFDADPPLQIELKERSLVSFEQGFVIYHTEDYLEAKRFFSKVLAVNAIDRAGEIYLRRCRQHLSMTMPESPKILVVDDTPMNVTLLSHFLTRHKFEALVAEDGETAITVARQRQPHLILLDVMMPGMDGFQTCQELKKDMQTQDIPVIFMTALTDVADKVKGFSVGAVDYITKPFQHEEVLARLNTHIAIRHLHQQLKVRIQHQTLN